MSESESASQRPVYAISVAADLAGLPIPTLRLYEQFGLVQPARTEGGTRRYSDADVARIQRVSRLVEEGVTLAATGRVLEIEDHNAELSARNADLRADNRELRRDNARLRRQTGETSSR
jgi:DNA-binding transcriptional MerR regulator